MSWNPGLKKFMLSLVFDTTPNDPKDSARFTGGLMVFLGSHPWGPWQQVFASAGAWPGGLSTTTCGNTQWGSGERADIPTKYMSADGRRSTCSARAGIVCRLREGCCREERIASFS